jgi:hypothetical protein
LFLLRIILTVRGTLPRKKEMVNGVGPNLFLIGRFSPLGPFFLFNPFNLHLPMRGLKILPQCKNPICCFVAYDALLQFYNQNNMIIDNTFQLFKKVVATSYL